MPSAPKRPCPHPGCGVLVAGGRCAAHKSEQRKQHDSTRAKTSERGYGWRWQQYTEGFKRHNPLCVHCLKQDVITPTQCVDHITPVRGPADPLFWDKGNHQALCNSCHSIKTATEDGGFGNKSSNDLHR
jgi:5-methylcytosine-specific restriction protein A